MPSVPSTKESGDLGPVCPHAARKSVTLKEVKIQDEPFQRNGGDDVDGPIRLEGGENAAERKWIRPDLTSRCTWKLGMSDTDSPHTQWLR